MDDDGCEDDKGHHGKGLFAVNAPVRKGGKVERAYPDGAKETAESGL